MAKGRRGQILILALLVMFVGAVILTGLFQYMGSSLLLATKGEENAVNYYAADSGIEDALYWLQRDQEDGDLWVWNEGEEQWEREGYTLNYTNSTANNRAVDVSVENNPSGCGDNCYLITSTATHNKSGVSTIIESYIRATPLEFWKFGDDAITSNYDVTILGDKGWVHGNVSYVDSITCNPEPCSVNGTINDPFEDGIPWWPETWAIAKYFEDQVDISKPFSGGSIDVAVNSTIGPLYIEGDLEIMSSVNGASASLAGIIYVTGDLTIDGNRAFLLDLNNQVIFVENKDAIIGDSIAAGHADVQINDYCNLSGSGAIFAIGDIWFEPKLITSSLDFTFIMSIEGWLNMQPASEFYGSVAGNLAVDVLPQNEIRRTEDDDFWNTFFNPEPVILKIITYDIVDR
jgi:hypothetical protein